MPDLIITPAATAPATVAAPTIPIGLNAAEFAAIMDASQAKLIAALKPAPAPVPAPAAAPVQTDSQRLAFLEKQHADMTAEKTKSVRNTAIDGALKTAEKDFTAPQLVALKTVFESQFGAGITVEGDKTFYNSPETGKIDIATQFATFLKGDVARSLKPPPSLPGGPGLDPATGKPGAPAVKGHEWEGKTFAEVQALKSKEPQKYNDLITKPENRASFMRMMATA